MLLLTDLDGVGADWEAGLDYIYDQFFKDHPEYAELPRTGQRGFGFEKVPGREHLKPVIRAAMTHPMLYRSLEPIDGWVEAIHEMRADGHDVFIVTSPFDSHATCHQDKVDWVRTVAGRDWGKRVILTEDKTIIQGDILFDDKPDIKGYNPTPAWEHVVSDAYHNREDSLGRRRLESWADWRTIVYGTADVS